MAQFARPDSDVSIGSWTDDGGGTTDIFQAIDEASASDTDFIRSENDPASSACEIGIGDPTDPEDSTNHVIRYRYQKNESGGGQPGQIDLTVLLIQGTTTIASQAHNDIATGFVAGSFTLSSGEADSITDYADLRLRFTADKPSGARTSWAEVSWAEFEVPDATAPQGSGTVNAVGSLAGTGTTDKSGSGAINAVGSLDGTGAVTLTGSGTANAVGGLAATGTTDKSGSGSINAVGAITGDGSAPASAPEGSGSINAVASLAGAGSVTFSGSGGIDVIGGLSATGATDKGGADVARRALAIRYLHQQA